MLKNADLGYFDDNRDGRVSRNEFVDKPNPLFARYDKKGTCRVTLDDIVESLSPARKSGRDADRR
jgi:Ca2+-binding EF-hand superfamily protein